jgi:hypothetical protein
MQYGEIEIPDGGAPPTDGNRERYRVRLPGFLVNEEIGLGDVIKRLTFNIGVGTCGGCEKRAAILNSWFGFSR